MVSFHFLNPNRTSSSFMSIGITGFVFTVSGIANDVKNSRSVSSCPYQWGGIVSPSSSADSRERLLNESPLSMVPCPHGEAAAALKEFLLYQRRLLSIVSLSRTVSHMISVGSVVDRKCWKSSGYSACSRFLGIISLLRPFVSFSFTTFRIFRC